MTLTMDPDRWRRIERIYELAIDRPADERERVLDAECAGDESLRREVEALIGRTPSAADFLNIAAVSVAAAQLADVEFSPVPPRIGPYQVTSKLGEGGMGAVYEAFDDRLQRPIARPRAGGDGAPAAAGGSPQQ